jgi:hypothetical protein
MIQGVSASLRQSGADFEALVKPLLLSVMPGKIFKVEGESHPALDAMDRFGGIDYLYLSPFGDLKGVASRIQSPEKDYRTFTVRCQRESGARTELAKRSADVQHPGIFPALTLQAYVRDLTTPVRKRILLRFAVARTSDLLKVVKDGGYRTQFTGQAQDGQASFYVVGWDAMVDAGCTTVLYERDNGMNVYKNGRACKSQAPAEELMEEDEAEEVTDADVAYWTGKAIR